MRVAVLAVLACGVRPDEGRESPVTTESPASATSPTGSVVVLHLQVWEPDPGCWQLVDQERPAEYWAGYEDYLCRSYPDTGRPHVYTLGTAAGECVAWAVRPTLNHPEGCLPEDDPWFLDCSTVPGCCDAGELPYLEPLCGAP